MSERLTSNLDEKVGDKLRRIKGVRSLAGSLIDVVSFEEANLVSVLVKGSDPGSVLFRGFRVLKGRALQEGDTKAAMLGRVLALNLKKNVGDTVDVAGEPFHVVGIFESDSLFENGGLVVPLAELQRMMGRKGYVSGFVIGADEPDREKVEGLAHRIESQIPGVAAVPARLRPERHPDPAGQGDGLGHVSHRDGPQLGRHPEHDDDGRFRADGRDRRAPRPGLAAPRILSLILGEALAIGLVGSASGPAWGCSRSRRWRIEPTSSNFISPDLSPVVLGIGLVLGVGLSLLGGLYPAVRAAALNPTEALRHE